jgi:hypothetical protein
MKRTIETKLAAKMGQTIIEDRVLFTSRSQWRRKAMETLSLNL